MKKGICLNPSFRPWRDPTRCNPDSWWDPAQGPALIEKELTVLRQLRLDVLRLEFPWWAIEKEAKGAFDWARADLIVRGAAAAGITLAPVLVFTPVWATAACSDPVTDCHSSRQLSTCAAQPPEPEDFYDFVVAIAGRYRGRIRFWEMWNEPDLPSYFAGSAEDYGRAILAPGYDAVKAADPAAQVLLGGPSSANAAWVATALVAAGHKVDILTFHDYGRSTTGSAGAADLVRVGRGKPVWLGEFGSQRADMQPRLLRDVFGRGSGLDAAIWYELRDDDIFSASGPCASETYGLLDRHYQPKASFALFQGLARAS